MERYLLLGQRVKAIKTGQQKLYCRWIRFEHLDLILLIVPQHQVQLGKLSSHAFFIAWPLLTITLAPNTTALSLTKASLAPISPRLVSIQSPEGIICEV